MKYGAWMLMRMPCCFAAAPILAAAHAAAALILEGGKAHLREPCGSVLAFLEAGGCEGLGISGRAETGLSHGVSPPFCAVRAQ